MITQLPHESNPVNINLLLKQQLTLSKFSHQIQSINLSLIKHLQTQIQHQTIIIPQHQKPFKLKKISQTQQHNVKNQLQMSQLVNKKLQIQNQLKKIQHQEYKLHINHSKYAINQTKLLNQTKLSQSKLSQSKLSQSMSSSSPQRMFRSQLRQEQKQKIKQLINDQKRFINELKMKQRQYYEYLQKDRISRIQVQQNIKRQKCEQRKLYWQRIKSEIGKRQQSRKKAFIKQQSRLQQIKKCKKLYQVKQNQWNNKLVRDQNIIKQATNNMRKNNKFDLSKLNQHQKQYSQLVKQKQSKRQQSINQFQNKMKLTLPKIPNSKFYAQLVQQQKKIKLEQQDKEKRKLQLYHKQYQFTQKVKNNFKPKIDQSLKNDLLITNNQFDKNDKKTGLPLGQIQNLGNDYMKQVHRNLAIVQAAKGQNSKVTQSQIIKKPTHQNYLVQLKQKRSQQGVKISLTNQVTKIMKNTSYSTIQRIQRAKLVAKRLQSKQNTKSSALISSINEKMKILRVLNQS